MSLTTQRIPLLTLALILLLATSCTDQPTQTTSYTATPAPTIAQALVPAAVPSATLTATLVPPTPTPTVPPTTTPTPTLTLTASPTRATVAATRAPASTAPAKPPVVASTGNIPPVGSGPLSVDEAASGPWNCVGVGTLQTAKEWYGDFYIAVRGGPGGYTISDSENCHWDTAELKFICRYRSAIGQSPNRTLYVSCPGCAKQAVTVQGRGVTARSDDPNVCRLTTFVPAAPAVTPVVAPTKQGQPTAPLYPRSPIVAWDKATFANSVKTSLDSIKGFQAYFRDVAAGRLGDCSLYFWKYYSVWESQPGFRDVPDDWYGRYYQFRTILESVRVAAEPISQICTGKGGTVSEQVDRQVTATLANAVQGLETLYGQIQGQ